MVDSDFIRNISRRKERQPITKAKYYADFRRFRCIVRRSNFSTFGQECSTQSRTILSRDR